jgi:hypothetical protein
MTPDFFKYDGDIKVVTVRHNWLAKHGGVLLVLVHAFIKPFFI